MSTGAIRIEGVAPDEGVGVPERDGSLMDSLGKVGLPRIAEVCLVTLDRTRAESREQRGPRMHDRLVVSDGGEALALEENGEEKRTGGYQQ